MSSDLLVHNVFYLNKLITNFFSGKKIVFLIIPDTRLTMKLDINLDAQQKYMFFTKYNFALYSIWKLLLEGPGRMSLWKEHERDYPKA